MKKIRMKLLGGLLAGSLLFGSIGCSGDFKTIMVDQAYGVFSTILSSLTESIVPALINSVLAGINGTTTTSE